VFDGVGVGITRAKLHLVGTVAGGPVDVVLCYTRSPVRRVP
jgi:hypothetical protein